MTTIVGTIATELILDDARFTRALINARKEVHKFGNFLDSVGNIGRNLTFGITAPFAAIQLASAKAAVEFDKNMRNISSIAQFGEATFQRLSNEVLEFGKQTRSGAISASEALYTIFSAGVEDVPLAMETMRQSLLLAEANLSDLTSTTNALVTTMLAYGATIEDVSTYSDAFTATVQFGVGTMDEFKVALSRVTPTAAAAGVSFTELGASLAFLTQQGQTTYTASTSVNNVLNKLLAPTAELQTEFNKLGVSSGVELIKKFGGLQGALDALKKSVNGDIVAFNKLWGSIQAKRGALAFFNNMEKYEDIVDKFTNTVIAGGVTQKAWDEQNKSFAATLEKLKSALEGLGIVIGSITMEGLTPILKIVTDVVLAFSNLDKNTLQLALTFGTLLAAAGPVLWILSSLLSPINIVIALFGTLAMAVATNFDSIKATVTNTLESIFGNLTQFKNALENFISVLIEPVPTQTLDDLKNSFQNVEFSNVAQVAVQQGDSFWSIWQKHFKEQISWEEFRDTIIPEQPAIIHPEDILTFDFGSTGQSVPKDLQKQRKALRDEIATYQNVETPSFSNRLATAFESLWTQAQPALEQALGNFVSWVADTAIPTIVDAIRTHLPNIAFGIGEIIGTVGAGIIQGVQEVIKLSIAGLDTSVEANIDTGKAEKEYESIPEKFMAGFRKGVGNVGGEENNLVNSIVTALTVGVTGVVIFSGFATKFVSTMFAALRSAVLTNPLALLIVVGVIQRFDQVMFHVKETLNSLLRTFEAFGRGDIGKGIESVVSIFVNLALALAQIPLGVAEVVVDIINGLFGTNFNVDQSLANIGAVLNTFFAIWLTGLQQIGFEFQKLILNMEFGIQSTLLQLQKVLGQDTSGTQSRIVEIRAEQFRMDNTTSLQNALQRQLLHNDVDLSLEIPIKLKIDEQGNLIEERISIARALGTENFNDVFTTAGVSHNMLQNYANKLFENGLNVEEIPALLNIQKTLGDAFVIPTDQQTIFTTMANDVNVLKQASEQYGIVLDNLITKLDTMKESASIWQNLGNALINTVTGVNALTGSGGSRMNVEARAKGGPVASGSPYLVGERGPELFVPKTSGTIVPNDKISGGKQTVNNVTIHAVTDVNYLLRELSRRGIKL